MKKKMLILLVGLLCIALLIVFVTMAALRKKNTSGDEPSDFQTQQTNAGTVAETQTQENPTETTSVPNQQETGSTQPTTESIQSTTESTQPTTGSTQPTTESTQPTTESTQPTTGSTQPITGSTQPTTGSTQPTTESTQPTTESTQPTTGSTQPTTNPTDPEDPTQSTEGVVVPPEEIPPIVEILPDTDPDTGEEVGISFPCQIPGYDLIIEKMAPFSGIFVEDGSNANVQDVAMLLVRNNGNTPIEYTQISVMCGEDELLFDISALPAGQKLVVQEKNGKAISGDDIKSATALVIQRTDMEMSAGKVRVVDNGNNTLTIQNLTDQTIPTVRVFYKYYMQEEAIYVGGIAFTVRISKLGAGASISISPSHYTSQTSRVVMVRTYDSEV